MSGTTRHRLHLRLPRTDCHCQYYTDNRYNRDNNKTVETKIPKQLAATEKNICR